MSHGGALHFKDGTAADTAPSQTTFPFSSSTIIGQAPYTNVGIVTLPQGVGTYSDAPYVPPRDPAAAPILNYAPLSDGLVPETYIRTYPQTFGDLESTFAPEESTEIYNTELNPYNPSSQFFPYEPDYSGILSTQAYLEDKGMPLRMETAEGPTGQVVAKDYYDEETGEIDTAPYGYYLPKQYTQYSDAGQVTVNPFAHYGESNPTEELRDTIFHEGKHYFIDNYGRLIPAMTALPEAQHSGIYFADMFRENPYFGGSNLSVNQPTALGFMQMHNFSKNIIKKAKEEDKPVTEVLNEAMQQSYQEQQKENVEKIIEEVQQGGGGGPVGMVGTPTGTVQSASQGPAGMQSVSAPVATGPNLTNRAQGGLVSISDLTKRL
jgi:hypothetical protein